jgi:2-amino-4-hydroxy-6-hydroxymethyldihydropteridine diphosphokinase
MSERAFVLAPLAEVAPDWRHPVLGLRVSELLDQLPPGALDGLTPLDPQVAVKLKTS